MFGGVNSPTLSDTTREICYLIVHNKLPVKERLFRVNMTNDPYCPLCPGAEILDLENFYFTCIQVLDIWKLVSKIIADLLGQTVPNSNLIRFPLPASQYENEISWLLGNYFEKVWNDIVRKGTGVKTEEFFGFLKFKYRADQQGASHCLTRISDLE